MRSKSVIFAHQIKRLVKYDMENSNCLYISLKVVEFYLSTHNVTSQALRTLRH